LFQHIKLFIADIASMWLSSMNSGEPYHASE
jgi:hypothetical protein